MGIFFIVAWPLSKLLDCLLGKDHSTFFRRAELKVLVDLHGTGDGNTEQLSTDEVVIIKVLSQTITIFSHSSSKDTFQDKKVLLFAHFSLKHNYIMALIKSASFRHETLLMSTHNIHFLRSDHNLCFLISIRNLCFHGEIRDTFI